MTVLHRVESSRRPRVLIGAYACAPIDEPEAAAGWAFACAAAEEHDVTVITRTRFRGAVTAALAADDALRARLRVEFVDRHPLLMRLRQRLPGGLYVYYPLWQRLLTRTARRLHTEDPFDVAHHVTFANDWMKCGLADIDGLPLVWGPVGGASRVPYWRLRRWLGARGVVTELSRDLLTAIPRRIWGDRAARRAAVVVAQNPDVARRFRKAEHCVVEPNAAMTPGSLPTRVMRDAGQPVAVFAGRLLAWKGARLAVEAISRPEARRWRLEILGDGYDRPAIEKLIARLDVRDRVTLRGHQPRDEVLSAFASADAMLFPSMHDQAGWVAAEASSMGCPVVCLPLGGPATLADRNAIVADLVGDIPAGLAARLDDALEFDAQPHDRWSTSRMPGLVAEWYRIAMNRGAQR